MDKQNISRINELSAIARTRPLTQEEAAERAERRKKYLEVFRGAFKSQLDNTVIQREDGSKEPFRRTK